MINSLRVPIALLLAVTVGVLPACQTLREVTTLKDVEFRIERVSDAQLAGIRLGSLDSYADLGGADVARLASAVSRGEVPFSFTLRMRAENPSANSVSARLTRMEWTVLLNDQQTVSGVFDQNVELPPGTPKEIPVDVQLDLVEFFGDDVRALVDLAAAVGGEGPPTNVKVRARPTVRTPLGPMKYPKPITVVHREVGASERE